MAQYIVRLDDACSTLRLENWERIEAVLDRLGIRPIVGVIPDNQHPSLYCGPALPHFWDKVRSWQSKGWMIAMHGHQHILKLENRHKGLVPLEDTTEFVGFPLELQREKIRQALRIFQSHDVTPTAWMA